MTVSQQVEIILRDYPETRSSDRKLILKLWETRGLFLSNTQRDKFMDMPSTETIRRVRQSWQESGQYKATERVASERRHKSLVVQQNAPTASPGTMARVIENVDEMPDNIGNTFFKGKGQTSLL